jgi:hypothetical protein
MRGEKGEVRGAPRVTRSRNTDLFSEALAEGKHAIRDVSVFRFPLSRPSLFTALFISSAHLTTFLKMKKTYGNVFRGTD